VIIRKSLTQWLWVLAAILIVVGVIRLLLGTYLLGGVIGGVGLVLALVALSGRTRSSV
jgi:hypothetical protein